MRIVEPKENHRICDPWHEERFVLLLAAQSGAETLPGLGRLCDGPWDRDGSHSGPVAMSHLSLPALGALHERLNLSTSHTFFQPH